MGELKHLDPNSFRQTTAYNEMTPVVNWEQRLSSNKTAAIGNFHLHS